MLDCKRWIVIRFIETARIRQSVAIGFIGTISSQPSFAAGNDRADDADLISTQFFECFFVFHIPKELNYLEENSGLTK